VCYRILVGDWGRPFAAPEAMPHISDDSLEQYAMGTLPEADLGAVEEHLLTCGNCQDRLKVTDNYVAAMRSAMKKDGRRVVISKASHGTSSAT
jgi:hypothetical protein